MSVQYYRDLLGTLFAGKKCILATGPVAGQTRLIETLRDLGATAFLLLADSEGTGDLPEGPDVSWHVLVHGKASDMMTGIRNYEAALTDLPPDVVAAVEAFDPDGEAIVLGSHVSDTSHILGRPRLGAREPAWAALEDKVVIDDFWDRAAVPRAPSRILDARDLDACLQATADLDDGHGTIWAGDAREGFNGGAAYLRHIGPTDDTAEAHAFFTAHCDRLRIMPFLPGIPCSIHGVVLPDTVLAIRPVEMVVFRKPHSQELQYAGFSTLWDPPSHHREHLRSLARKVGQALRSDVGYRGAFTVDGVLTDRGFLPTELNPRSGGAFSWLTRGERDLPLSLIDMAIRDGRDLDFRPQQLEDLVLHIADKHRFGGGWTVIDTPIAETNKFLLVPTPDSPLPYRLATDEETEADTEGLLLIGPSAAGGFVRYLLHDHSCTPGPSVAPTVAQVFRFTDAHFHTGIGPLIPADDLSPEAPPPKTAPDAPG